MSQVRHHLLEKNAVVGNRKEVGMHMLSLIERGEALEIIAAMKGKVGELFMYRNAMEDKAERWLFLEERDAEPDLPKML